MNHYEDGLILFDYTDEDGNVPPEPFGNEQIVYQGIDRKIFDGIEHTGLQELLLWAESEFVVKQPLYLPVRNLNLDALSTVLGMESNDLKSIRVETTYRNIIIPMCPEKGSSFAPNTHIYDANRTRALIAVSWAVDYSTPLYQVNWQETYERVMQGLGTNAIAKAIHNPKELPPPWEYVVV